MEGIARGISPTRRVSLARMGRGGVGRRWMWIASRGTLRRARVVVVVANHRHTIAPKRPRAMAPNRRTTTALNRCTTTVLKHRRTTAPNHRHTFPLHRPSLPSGSAGVLDHHLARHLLPWRLSPRQSERADFLDDLILILMRALIVRSTLRLPKAQSRMGGHCSTGSACRRNLPPVLMPGKGRGRRETRPLR